MRLGWLAVLRSVGAFCAVGALACSPAGAPTDGARDRSPSGPTSFSRGPAPLSPSSSVASANATADAGTTPPPRVSPDRARELLFPEGVPSSLGCKPEDVRCFVEARFADSTSAQKLALALFDEVGDVVGLERDHIMEGGFRGEIHIVPERPTGKWEKHLSWIVDAQRDSATFLRALEARASSGVRYRHGALGWRFFRSVGRTTPSAYAGGWEVGYNVSGSLHGSREAVLETIFHEVFHLNDQEHGNWSRRALGSIADGIVQKCGTNAACLKPFAPMKTMVRGGTYYAFQPNNGDSAHEYAAELATRYFLEQRAVIAGNANPLPMPGAAPGRFKCGSDINARAWRLLADEFFGGVDLTPACE
jgi:hypothetical protein